MDGADVQGRARALPPRQAEPGGAPPSAERGEAPLPALVAPGPSPRTWGTEADVQGRARALPPRQAEPGGAPPSGAPPSAAGFLAAVDAILSVLVIALLGMLVRYAAVLPNARHADRLEQRAAALESEVAQSAADVERLRREITALQSDPYAIERSLKRRMRELRPDLFGPDGAPLPPPPPPPKRGRSG